MSGHVGEQSSATLIGYGDILIILYCVSRFDRCVCTVFFVHLTSSAREEVKSVSLEVRRIFARVNTVITRGVR